MHVVEHLYTGSVSAFRQLKLYTRAVLYSVKLKRHMVTCVYNYPIQHIRKVSFIATYLLYNTGMFLAGILFCADEPVRLPRVKLDDAPPLTFSPADDATSDSCPR